MDLDGVAPGEGPGVMPILGVGPGDKFDHRVAHGTRGSVSWSNGLKIVNPENVGQQVYTIPELQQLMMTSIDTEEKARLFPNGVMNDVAIEFWDFADAVINRRKPEIDGGLGAKAEAIPMAAFESSWLGQPVKVEKVLRCEVENYQREINESLGLS